MTKSILLTYAVLVLLSSQSLGGRDFDNVKDLIQRGRPNGQSPHQTGHNGDLLFGYKKPPQGNTNNPSLLTRGTTFYTTETSDRHKKRD